MSSMTPEEFLQQASHGSSATTASNGDDSAASTVAKKKRNQPGTPDPDAEVIALSPGTLMATNRYMCEVCLKGFQRDQNLQLHRRGHNLPWKLKQRTPGPVKRRVYICPETSCPHHDPSRALGDLTGIKKHFCRKHGEKKWKCDKCSKRYAVQSDWKAHIKICGTREYRCDCGTIFSRRDSFITHRAFCDALAEENYKVQQQNLSSMQGGTLRSQQSQDLLPPNSLPNSNSSSNTSLLLHPSNHGSTTINVIPQRSPLMMINSPSVAFSSSSVDLPNGTDPSQASCLQLGGNINSGTAYNSTSLTGGAKDAHFSSLGSAFMSATALLQKAAEMGAMVSDNSISPVLLKGFAGYSSSCTPVLIKSSCDPSDASNSGRLAPPPNEGHLFTGNIQGSSSQHAAASHVGLFDSQHMMLQQGSHGGGHEENMYLQGAGIVGGRDHVGQYGGSERTTVDFLRLGPVGQMGIGERCEDEERAAGLAYDYQDHEQQNLDNEQGYHGQNSDGASRSNMGRPMWNF